MQCLVLWAGQGSGNSLHVVSCRGGHLIIDVNPGLKAVLLELLFTKLQLQILTLSRLDVLSSEALSPADVRSSWGLLLYATV